ncbi:Arogenate dehydratase/prephenate dehydratase 2 [Hibiscus syriacus]|uniref:Arogenate dehydratase/prephenate dehydratase 2 n=1 Tax=Hibiscus syriacus TaxID=106335 RepID=A0A6A3D875_HIBSY|nr:Arogenate dehydratase/prephenate dehydratase 2 [Hibiscus syriacus]
MIHLRLQHLATAIVFSLKRRRFAALFASLHDCNNINDGSNKITKAVGLEKLFVDSPFDVDSKDSPSQPRPLTSAQLSNTISDGPRLRVAYQGVRGAYSEAAAEKAYLNCEPVPCDQFDAAFEAVEKWLVDRAVLPIENSLGGSIHRNYDLLLRHSLHIFGEVKLAVRHCLLANHVVRVEDLKRVLSHPQALAQCEYTLTKIGLSREAVDDTALAAKVGRNCFIWFSSGGFIGDPKLIKYILFSCVGIIAKNGISVLKSVPEALGEARRLEESLRPLRRRRVHEAAIQAARDDEGMLLAIHVQ